MEIILASAALAILLIGTAIYMALRNRKTKTQTTNIPTTQDSLDPDIQELLQQLPTEQRELLSRMVAAHGRLVPELRSLGTSTISEATPLILESWRLSEHLERQDLNTLIKNAATQPSLRPLADDMVRMVERQDELLLVLAKAATTVETADSNELASIQEELRKI